jgi:hypothetical protein
VIDHWRHKIILGANNAGCLLLLGMLAAIPQQLHAVSPVTCLQAQQNAQAKLTWTVPNDTIAYEIRHSTYTPFDWNTAAIWKTNRPAGGVQGTVETEIVTGLTLGTTHYFYMKSCNAVPTWSGLSNGATCYVDWFWDNGDFLAGDSAVVLYCPAGSWADYNNDGNLDMALLSYDENNSVDLLRLYPNISLGFSTGTYTALTGVNYSFSGAMSWGDYDNDGDLDLVVMGDDVDACVFRNTNGTFSDSNYISINGLTFLGGGECSWGDYDNDGDLDLAATGEDDTFTAKTRVYLNNNGSFNTYTSLTGVTDSSLCWGDYDNDGDLDLAVGGNSSAYIYRNTGALSTGNRITINASGLKQAALAWGDYDNDGDLDLALATDVSNRIYQNNGGNFSSYTSLTVLANTMNGGSLAWGDYDNDGDLDILMSGSPSLMSYASYLYRNNNGVFASDDYIALAGGVDGSNSWGDYDNDGDLDMLVAGEASALGMYRILKSLIVESGGTVNTAPSAPSSGFSTVYSDNCLQMRWGYSSDNGTNATPQKGLYYELRVATATSASSINDTLSKWVISPSTGAGTGFGTGQRIGSYPHGYCVAASTQPGFNLTGLVSNATYFWQVRAIDTGFRKSEWSSVQSTSEAPPGKLPEYRQLCQDRFS